MGTHTPPGAGRPRQPLPAPEADVRAILLTQSVPAAAVTLGIAQEQVYRLRYRFGLRVRAGTVPRHCSWSKGLTLARIQALLQAHTVLTLGLVARIMGCSRQAVYEKLLRLEVEGHVVALRSASGRRRGWVVGHEQNKERIH